MDATSLLAKSALIQYPAWKVRNRSCLLQIIRDLGKPRDSTQDTTNIISIINVRTIRIPRGKRDILPSINCYDRYFRK